MFLKKIELLGFKSFADKTIVKFDGSQTCIIGPNGSGKSNVSDALKWVLGEQSAKTLRGSSMEDIIFNGNSKRKPLSRASVSITISNEKGILPVDFKEISITRRIYRSGESEYLINNTICRLKDILELFMDTGLSKNSYSIISQGQIGSILTSNAYERRFIFEEAAGIVKYKNRKKIAINKLKATEQDLLRLNDILFELERQLRSLKYQAAKAEKYKSISEELKKVELLFLKREQLNLENRIVELSQEKHKFLDETIKLETTLNKNNSEIEQKKLEVLEFEREHTSLQSQIYELDEKIKNLEYRQLNSNNTIKNYRYQIDRLKEDSNKAAIKKEELKQTIKSEQENLLNLEKEYLESEIDKVQNEKKYNEFLTNLKDKEKNQEELKTDIFLKLNLSNSKKSAIESLDNQKKYISEQILELEKSLENLKIEDVTLKEKQFQLSEKINYIKEEIRISENKIEQYNEEKQISKNKEEKLKEQIEEHKQQLIDKETALKILISTEDDKYLDGIKELYELKNKESDEIEFIGLLGESITANEKYENAIGGALVSLIQSVVVQNKESLKKIINYFTEKKLGKVSVIDFEKIETVVLEKFAIEKLLDRNKVIGKLLDYIKYKDLKYAKIIDKLFFNYILVEDFDAAYDLSKEYKNMNFVTLSGEVFWENGQVTGGQFKVERNLLKRDRERKELKEEIDILKIKISNYIGDLELEKENLNNLESKILDINKILTENKMNLLDSEKNQQVLEDKISDIENNMFLFQEKEKSLTLKVTEFGEKIQKLTNELEEIGNVSKKSNENLAKLSYEISSLKKEQIEINNVLTKAKIKSAELKQKKIGIKDSISYYEKMIVEFGIRVKENLKDNIDLETKIKELILDIEKIEKEQSSNIRIKDELVEQNKVIQNKKIAKEEELNELEKNNQISYKSLNDFKDKMHKFDIELSQKETMKMGLLERVLEKYNINNEEFLSLKEDDLIKEDTEKYFSKTLSELKNQYRELENKLKGLGPVNLDAIEEYKEVNERNEFLNKQKLDLESAKKNLKDIIEKINKRATEKFLETFAKVNENFNTIINQLFDGGKASLSIIDEGDVLESGINIDVMPPGKKIQNVSLLSGGEKALVAIGLLFALFKVKPGPFCILDEIDAPLDETNIGRFTKLLGEYAKNTQFVIITHHKKTMEIADTLYGVTMQEKGVSSLLSIKFEEKNKIEDLAG